MKPAFEKLMLPTNQSFRCFNRETLASAARWHHHPEIELTYVARGAGTRIVGDHIASYGHEDLVLLGPNLPHTWQSDEYAGCQVDLHPAIVVQFRPDFLGSSFFTVPEFTLVRTMFERAARGLKFDPVTAARIGPRLAGLQQLAPPYMLIELLNCLIDLSEQKGATPLASIGFVPATQDRLRTRVEEVCTFISQSFRDPQLTHQQLASFAGMNPSAFSRFFRNATGKTAMDYLAELRVSQACRLLADTDQSIAEILEYAGFGNTSNFNRQFQRLRQMTPREYRRLHRKATNSGPLTKVN